ncbi:winged helix-turn-helix transcriptional regulator [archaeon]|nr:winged helix-turn-helix transcriptional regulator [archaeon]
MNFDSFLGEKRWEILQIIARRPSSPIEIAEGLFTTVSYVSQQLKLLEALGIVYKTKTGSAEKGKPRNLYALTNELSYLTILTKDFSEKKLIYLTEYHKGVLAIWMVENSSLHDSLHRVYLELQNYQKEIDSIFLDKNSGKMIIFSSSKTLKSKVDTFIKTLENKVDYSIYLPSDISKEISENHIPLLGGERIKKGGENEI